MENDYTTIKITREFKNYLESVGQKGETYEDVIKRLINHEEEKANDTRHKGFN
jgi:hypothetical protein